jgi:hypothetical protein
MYSYWALHLAPWVWEELRRLLTCLAGWLLRVPEGLGALARGGSSKAVKLRAERREMTK